MQRIIKKELENDNSEQADEDAFSPLSNEMIHTIFKRVGNKAQLALVSQRFRNNDYALRGITANRYIKLFIKNQYTLSLTHLTDCYAALRHIHHYHCHYLDNKTSAINKLHEYSTLILALLIIMQNAPRFTNLRIALNRGLRENAFVIAIGDDDAVQPLIRYSAVNDDDVNQMRNHLLQTFHTPDEKEIHDVLNVLIQQATQLNISDIQTKAPIAKRFLRFFRAHDDEKIKFHQQLHACIQAICNEIGLLRVEINTKSLGTQGING